ncbi:DNA repair protein RecO [Candidatus Colwellia aromaticivorans]|uniref:DNA repair protein RecO n=1 Tax=Candidatus Colwellia aromaticivorans TaxID=2267621 RepID=UPI000DF3A352|nr:DNA repair protein RecO [Candidatus Colwellia aromaticivorans]
MVEQKAFVLHVRPYQENQQLVELLTEHDGKVSALVYVGQSKRSIKKALLQPFLPLNVAFKENGSQNTSLRMLTRIEANSKSYALTKNSLYSAFYLNELLVRLLTDDIICETLFSQYQLTITALSQGLAIAPQLRAFELSLLDELGLSLDFTPIFEENSEHVAGFYYVVEQGFIPAYHYAIKNITTPWFNTVHLQAIAEQNYDIRKSELAGVEQTFKLLMRQIFHHLLEGKPLNSRKLFVMKKYKKE